MKRTLLFLLVIYFFPIQLTQISAQVEDEEMLSRIYKTALENPHAYSWLHDLTQNVGHRLSGSQASIEAAHLMKSIMDTMQFDTVFFQDVMVPHWERGEEERLNIYLHKGSSINMTAMAIGNSVGTGDTGINAEVIEVHSIEQVKEMAREDVEGKILFYNRPMDSLLINTFQAYGGAVDQRVIGASTAAEKGAVAVIVRSMTTRTSDVIHTGTLFYLPDVPQIPAFSISTKDSDKLSQMLKNKEVNSAFMRNTSKMLEDAPSYNVIGEIRGTEFPDEIILVGGHLDSWDIGEGAHDDGAGCVHSMAVADILNKMHYRPKRTLRVVLFMNEENGSAGARKYAEVVQEENKFHLAAFESDAGGFTPQGLGFDAHEDVKDDYLKKVRKWQDLFIPYDISLRFGGSGADVGPLMPQKGLLGGLRPDSNRYFDLHHSAEDTFDKVNPRELMLGAATMTAIVYLVDKYGL